MNFCPLKKKSEPLPSAQEVMKRLLKRYKSVCLCVGVAKLLLSLVKLSLCHQKELHLIESGASFHSSTFAVS